MVLLILIVANNFQFCENPEKCFELEMPNVTDQKNNLRSFFRNILPKLVELEENYQNKNEENLDLTPDDLQDLVQLFKTNAKSLKEKYGAYNINMPLSNHVIACFDDYFEVSK